MTHVLVLLLALLIGVVAGLRALTPPAVVAWGAALGWLPLDGKWAEWVGHPITVTVLTILLVVELVTDQLPKTPSRKTTPQFVARILTGAFAGAVIGSAWFHTFSSLGAGIIGAVLGTLGGYRSAPPPRRGQRRPRLAGRADGGRHRRAWWVRRGRPGDHALTPAVGTHFDAIVVGAGQAGPPLAGRLTAAGQTVAVIERKLVGGTCVNYGCIPTKTLVASAHTAHVARRGAEFGISGPATSRSTWQRSRRARTGSCSMTATASSPGSRGWTAAR